MCGGKRKPEQRQSQKRVLKKDKYENYQISQGNYWKLGCLNFVPNM